MATYEEAAAGLSQALESGNTQDALAAQALYAEALGDDEAPEVELGPIKVDPVPADLQEEDEDLDATAAAEALAEAEGVDLSEVEGSGADGRILVSDVQAEVDAENEGLA